MNKERDYKKELKQQKKEAKDRERKEFYRECEREFIVKELLNKRKH